MVDHTKQEPDLLHPPAWARALPGLGRDLNAIRQRPLIHNTINATAALLVWGGIAGSVLAGLVVPVWIHLLVFGPLLGCFVFGHFVLIIHECSHDMFFVSKNRKRQKAVNRLIGRIAGAIFFTNYLVHWEYGHRVHHLRPNTPEDRQAVSTFTGRPLVKAYLSLLTPLGFIKLNPSNQYGFTWERFLGGVLFWVPLMVLSGTFIGWSGPLMLVIGMNMLAALNLTKKAQEHGGGLADEPWPILQSRTYLYPLQWLLSPFNINYHFEHHANFSVPWYLLPTYHARVKAAVPEALRPYYFHREFFRQLSGRKPLPPRDLLFSPAET